MDASLPATAKKSKVTRTRKSAHTGKIRIGKASATEIRETLGITRAEAQVAERALHFALGKKARRPAKRIRISSMDAAIEATRGKASKTR